MNSLKSMIIGLSIFLSGFFITQPVFAIEEIVDGVTVILEQRKKDGLIFDGGIQAAEEKVMQELTFEELVTPDQFRKPNYVNAIVVMIVLVKNESSQRTFWSFLQDPKIITFAKKFLRHLESFIGNDSSVIALCNPIDTALRDGLWLL